MLSLRMLCQNISIYDRYVCLLTALFVDRAVNDGESSEALASGTHNEWA